MKPCLPFPYLSPNRRTGRAASTLPATLMVVAAIATFLSLGAALTSQFGRFAGRQQGNGMEAAFCDAALEYAYAQWKTNVSAYIRNSSTSQVPAAGSILNAANTGNSSTANNTTEKNAFLNTIFPYASQLGIDTTSWLADPDGLDIYAVDQNGQMDRSFDTSTIVTGTKTVSTGVPPKTSTKNVPGYPGWTGFTYNYMARVKVKNTHYGSEGEYYQARRYFQVTKVPLCQAVAFYEGNLEIHPGADMYLNGPVHSNGSIYAQAMGIGLKLQFMNNVSYVNTFNDGTSNPSVTEGWTGADVPGDANPGPYKPFSPTRYSDGGAATAYAGGNYYGYVYPAVPASTANTTQVNRVDPIDPFGGASTNNNGLRDIIEVPATTNKSDQIAYNNAALVVEVNSNSVNLLTFLIPSTSITVKVRDVVQTSATYNQLVAANTTDYAAVLSAIAGGVTTPMQDKREAATAYITNLDMTKLDTITTMPSNAANATPLQKAFNTTAFQGGTVYIHDISGRTGGTRGAIRLINGRNLGENVSVASDNGVYIQGDYNTGGDSSHPVPSDASGATLTAIPQASNYNRYAASVMADAVTVLSNSWKDTNAGGYLNTRIATATTVNAAILSGDVASNTNNSGIASGGVHNFPRFLEDWTNVNFTYYGSLIQAFNSEQYTGYWQTNEVYHWPNRLWSFDTNFLDTQPPGLPQGVQFSRGRWERSYVDLNP